MILLARRFRKNLMSGLLYGCLVQFPWQSWIPKRILLWTKTTFYCKYPKQNQSFENQQILINLWLKYPFDVNDKIILKGNNKFVVVNKRLDLASYKTISMHFKKYCNSWPNSYNFTMFLYHSSFTWYNVHCSLEFFWPRSLTWKKKFICERAIYTGTVCCKIPGRYKYIWIW